MSFRPPRAGSHFSWRTDPEYENIEDYEAEETIEAYQPEPQRSSNWDEDEPYAADEGNQRCMGEATIEGVKRRKEQGPSASESQFTDQRLYSGHEVYNQHLQPGDGGYDSDLDKTPLLSRHYSSTGKRTRPPNVRHIPQNDHYHRPKNEYYPFPELGTDDPGQPSTGPPQGKPSSEMPLRGRLSSAEPSSEEIQTSRPRTHASSQGPKETPSKAPVWSDEDEAARQSRRRGRKLGSNKELPPLPSDKSRSKRPRPGHPDNGSPDILESEFHAPKHPPELLLPVPEPKDSNSTSDSDDPPSPDPEYLAKKRRGKQPVHDSQHNGSPPISESEFYAPKHPRVQCSLEPEPRDSDSTSWSDGSLRPDYVAKEQLRKQRPRPKPVDRDSSSEREYLAENRRGKEPVRESQHKGSNSEGTVVRRRRKAALAQTRGSQNSPPSIGAFSWEEGDDRTLPTDPEWDRRRREARQARRPSNPGLLPADPDAALRALKEAKEPAGQSPSPDRGPSPPSKTPPRLGTQRRIPNEDLDRPDPFSDPRPPWRKCGLSSGGSSEPSAPQGAPRTPASEGAQRTPASHQIHRKPVSQGGAPRTPASQGGASRTSASHDSPYTQSGLSISRDAFHSFSGSFAGSSFDVSQDSAISGSYSTGLRRSPDYFTSRRQYRQQSTEDLGSFIAEHLQLSRESLLSHDEADPFSDSYEAGASDEPGRRYETGGPSEERGRRHQTGVPSKKCGCHGREGGPSEEPGRGSETGGPSNEPERHYEDCDAPSRRWHSLHEEIIDKAMEEMKDKYLKPLPTDPPKEPENDEPKKGGWRHTLKDNLKHPFRTLRKAPPPPPPPKSFRYIPPEEVRERVRGKINLERAKERAKRERRRKRRDRWLGRKAEVETEEEEIKKIEMQLYGKMRGDRVDMVKDKVRRKDDEDDRGKGGGDGLEV
ncbi:hypothetical protein GQ43DRAFT_435260 [Delitschia confertaspora ATCC 74209]|uniref:Uncharacterized protein n=1 Tax=Delitschia confertaspora ATCC 74209 TaxID=1513339 RepID=A0A9P4JFF6_9PLEO|nr:hypothetical protein GQ43DRAFT_435260 [Delitschia confertaspora ATCC 74209]